MIVSDNPRARARILLDTWQPQTSGGHSAYTLIGELCAELDHERQLRADAEALQHAAEATAAAWKDRYDYVTW
jgi:hypothetical protein